MDQEDRCMTYGHAPVLTRDFRRTYRDGKVVVSKRRVKMYKCSRCGASDV